jgi:hypothetical protein
MTTFTLRIDLSGHLHPGNPAAQRALVRQQLGFAMQAIGSNFKRDGDLSIPIWNASEGVSRPAVIGCWDFSDAADPP